jgi:hypothetical protein
LFLGNVAGLSRAPDDHHHCGRHDISTLLNLFALPALYLRYGASREVDLELLSVPGADLPAVATD